MANQGVWEYTETQIWRVCGDAVSLYHVFGLVTTKNGVVMTFCEAREGNGGDAGCIHHIYMRRSLDEGRTFEENVVLIPGVEGTCFGNPTPVLDEETGRVYLFYANNHGNCQTDIYVIHTDDDGVTWSEPVFINPAFENTDIPRPFHLCGPGHGIQVKKGAYAGRLIVPFWHREKGVEAPALERGYCTSMLYSDDHGATWKNGEFCGMAAYLNETRIAQVTMAETRIAQVFGDSDALVMQGRNVNSHYRYQAISHDGGVTWSEPEPMPVEEANVCDAGILSFSNEKMPNALLVSRVSQMKRRDMEILVSLNGGESYEMKFLLPPGDAMPGYSDLTLLPDGAIGLLHCRADHVLFSRISLEALTNGWYNGNKRNVWLG